MGYPFAEKYSGKGIFLNSNINPFGPSPLALKRLRLALKNANFYPSDYSKLKKKLVKVLANQGINVDERHIVFGNGSDETIEFVFKFLMKKYPDLSVITGDGTFAFYEYCARALGLNVVKVKLKDYCYDLEGILDVARKNKPAIICFSNPINPTGKIIPFRDYESFLKLCGDGIFVLSDEAYFEFAYFLNKKGWRGDDYRSALHISKKDNIFVTRTFSKVYGLAGVRLGYLISSFSHQIESEIKPPFNVNYFAILAGESALSDKKHVLKTLKNNLEGMTILEKFFAEMGIFFVGSWANFIFFHVKKKDIKDELRKKGIFVRDMTAYGFPEFLRVSVGKKNDILTFCKNFRKILLR